MNSHFGGQLASGRIAGVVRGPVVAGDRNAVVGDRNAAVKSALRILLIIELLTEEPTGLTFAQICNLWDYRRAAPTACCGP